MVIADMGEAEGMVTRFGVWDYVIFGLMLLISMAIGVYSALSGGRQRTADEFLLGNRNMGIIPVSMSITVSFISAISVIGTPGEIYIYDTMFAWSLISYFMANVLVSRLFVPVFFRLHITSVYEYLEMRFNRTVRSFGTVIFSVQTIIYMGVVMYTPALAINAVTGMDIWACVISTGLVCIFYTSVVSIIANIFQTTYTSHPDILVGVVSVIVKGTLEMGGVKEVWRIAQEGNRISFSDFSVDPRVRYTVWSILIGFTTVDMTFGTSQTIAQRILATGSQRKATLSLYLSALGSSVIVGLCIASGVVMYAYYVNCDPLTMGIVQSKDQIMPLLVMELFGDSPGLPGLFLSAVVSASISSLSSGINALAAITAEDGVKIMWPDMHPRTYARSLVIAALLFGVVSIGSAFVASQLGGGVLSLCLSLIGIFNGSLLGVFLQGVYSTRCNPIGAIVGLLSGVLFVGWIKVGSLIYPSSSGVNVLSVDGCTMYNATEIMVVSEMISTYDSSSPPVTSSAVEEAR
ncbi:sodium-coupled monocarboxylate transporter 1-like [Diadema setosum]|uniref:sodium-coupled monocarboxylate transporter 1-like n=1 Tax=Diadema setosum TaxID=31175 RepID=UPI003B3B575A